MYSFNDFIVENNNYPGKQSFNIFLEIVDEFDKIFIANNYLSNNDYSLFFKTDKINRVEKLLLRLKKFNSLIGLHNILLDIKEKRLSFYFGIKGYELEYGFYDLDSNNIHKVGLFKITSSYIKNLNSKSTKPIRNILKNTNLQQTKILHTAAKDFKKFLKGMGSIDIVEYNRVVNIFKKDIFKESDIIENTLYNTLNNWAMTFSWYKHFYYYVTIDGDISFYIKIKDVN